MTRRNPTRTDVSTARREAATLRDRLHSEQRVSESLRWQLRECKADRVLLVAKARRDAFDEIIATYTDVIERRQREYDERPDDAFARADREEIATLRVVLADLQRMRDAGPPTPTTAPAPPRPIALIALDMLASATGWEADARLLGNTRADEIAMLASDVLARKRRAT